MYSTNDAPRNATTTAQDRASEESGRQIEKLKAIAQLTGGVAHELNNLLVPILASFDMLNRPDVTPDRASVLIERGLAAVHRATSFVRPMLAFAGLQQLQPVAVDVGSLVTALAERIRSTAGPMVAVKIRIDQDLAFANGDPVHLEAAILALTSNARDAMREGGELRITVTAASPPAGGDTPSRLEPGVRICVEDTGIGMDEVIRERAVEPFFSTKGIGKGRGLGLSMAHGVAVQLGGALTLSSQVGVGTQVELLLPAATPHAVVSPSRENASNLDYSASTALLVDDDDLVRSSTADMLVQLGINVREACSAEEALGLIGRGQRFDLLITDYLMTGPMNGVDLANAVRRQCPQTLPLIMSGFVEAGAITADLPHLAKPFRQVELAACIAALARTGRPA